MRVLVLTPEIKRASYRLRIADVFPRVDGLTFETVELPREGPGLDAAIDRAGEFDAVILQKRLLERAPAWRLRSRAKKIIYEADDAVMVTRPGGEWWWPARKRKARFAATAEILDLAVVGNSYLKGLMGARNVRTELIPTCLEPSEYAVSQHPGRPPLRLVWIGSGSTQPYLESLLPAIENASRKLNGELSLSVISDRAIRTSPALKSEFTSWSLAAEKASLASADVGIAPTPDDAWSRGKCGFKLLQYMAAGLATVASPVGANAEIVQHSTTGLHATSPADWTQAIIALAGDSAVRKRFGQLGRSRVESQYAITTATKKWRDILFHCDIFKGSS